MVQAIIKETELQKDFLQGEEIETIYFGGGTPSLLNIEDLRLQIDQIKSVFSIVENAEVTLEANPDDISKEKLLAWKNIGINRLSIGVQSFLEEDLVWMNRAHNAELAVKSLDLAVREFENISIDLIYGSPFRPGMNASADIKTSTKTGVIAIPIIAVAARDANDENGDKKKDPTIPEDEQATTSPDELKEVVFVLNKEGKVEMRTVKTGIQDINNIEILSGLKEDEQVVTAPYNAITKTLKTGAKVKVVAKDKLFEK